MLEAVTKSSKGIGHWIKIHLYVKKPDPERTTVHVLLPFFFFYQCFIEGLLYLNDKELSVLTDLAEATYIYDRYAAVRQKRNCQPNV